MGTQICSNCGGAGTITDYNSKKMVSANYYAYDEKICYSCGGSGNITVKDVTRTYDSSQQKKQETASTKSKTIKNSSSPDSTLKGIFTFLGFLFGAVFGFQISAGNWVATLITATIIAGISRFIYKIIIVLIILVILYLVFIGK